MIFRLEKSNTITQWNGKGLALVKYDNTTCAWKGRESVQTPAASGRFRLGSGHVWHCMEYTSYWIYTQAHLLKIMYISANFIKISLNIIHTKWTKHNSFTSIIERVTRHLTDEKPLSRPIVTWTTPDVYHYGAVYQLHMIFRLEGANPNTYWDSDHGLAWV